MNTFEQWWDKSGMDDNYRQMDEGIVDLCKDAARKSWQAAALLVS